MCAYYSLATTRSPEQEQRASVRSLLTRRATSSRSSCRKPLDALMLCHICYGPPSGTSSSCIPAAACHQPKQLKQLKPCRHSTGCLEAACGTRRLSRTAEHGSTVRLSATASRFPRSAPPTSRFLQRSVLSLAQVSSVWAVGPCDGLAHHLPHVIQPQLHCRAQHSRHVAYTLPEGISSLSAP